VGVLVVCHIILVRRHGVVPPFDAQPPGQDRQQSPAEALPSADEPETVTASLADTTRTPETAEPPEEPVRVSR
jgi:ubiquinol-cytochrome c reductase cytochrome b subunit